MRDLLTVLAGLLLLTLLTALVGPAFVDWSLHRAVIEEQLKRATGLDIVTTGPIQVRALPSPRLTLTGVRVGEADPVGTRLTAEKAVAEMEIGPLLRGAFQLSRLDLEGADITLAWREGAVALPPITAADTPLAGVERLSLSRSQLLVRDNAGATLAALPVSGVLAAPQLSGSVRFDGEIAGQTLRLSVGERDAEGRLRLKALASADGVKAEFDGWIGLISTPQRRVSFRPDGQLQAQLLPAAAAPAQPQAQTTPLATLSARLVVAATGLSLEGLTIESGPGRLEGDARWSGAAQEPAQVRLQTRRADLSGWLAQRNALAQAWLPPPWLADRLPETELTLRMDQVVYRGEEAQEAEFAALWRAGHLKPLRGALRFAGASLRFSDDQTGQLSATLDAPDLRRIALAMQRLDLPQALAEDIAALGAAEVALNLAPDRLGWRIAQWRAKGRFGQLGGHGRLIDGRLDLQGRVEAADLLFLARPLSALAGLWPGDLGLALNAQAVRIGDSPQGEGTLQVERSQGSWRLGALTLQGFDGLTLAARRTGADQGVPFTLEAARADAITALAERLADTPRFTQMARALRGVSPVRLEGAVRPRAREWLVAATGRAGSVALEASGRMDEVGTWRGGEISLSAPERAALFRVLGLATPATARVPTRASLRLGEAGPLLIVSGADGLSIEARAGSAEQAFSDGLAATLTAPSIGAVLPQPDPRLFPEGALSARFRLHVGDTALRLESLSADTPAGAVAGRLALSREGAVSGALNLPRLEAASLLALMLPENRWRTDTGWSSARFPAQDMSESLSLDLELRSAAITVPGLDTLAGQARLRLGDGAARLSDLALEGSGVRLQGAGEIERAGGLVSLRLTGTASGVDLGRLTGGEIEGLASVSVQLGAAGESPARVIATLAGAAQVTAPALSIARLDPQGLDRILSALDRDIMVTDAAALAQSLRRYVETAPWVVTDASLPFVVTAGVARLSPVSSARGDTLMTLSASHDGRTGQGEWRAALQMKTAPRGWNGSPPQIAAVSRGPWGQMARSYDASLLSNAVAQRALEREIARVEALEADIRERAMHNRRLRAERERREAEQRAAAAEAQRQREEAQRLERERLEQARAEQQRQEQARQEQIRAERERREAEQRAAAAEAQRQREEGQRLERERLERARAEQQRQEQARQEQIRAERERREAEQRAAAEAQRQRLERERLEQAREERQRLEQERLRAEQVRLEQQQQEAARQERERQEEARQRQWRLDLQQLGRGADAPTTAPPLPPPVTITPLPAPRAERSSNAPLNLNPALAPAN